ncbi:hypothetical protein QFZ77_004425 [Paenibacillus sp. V4I3]|nr:hypothetical protein [Paenibacillus sp. V4I3]MDQ0888163.1 hypothetical protein [Paenibacillus sp. V4I9]
MQTNDQNTVTPTAPPNKYSWYDFTPIKSNSYGTVVQWEYSTNTVFQDVNRDWVDLYMTRIVGGFQDGIFQQVVSDYPPTY